jgi:hypothetical protein
MQTLNTTFEIDTSMRAQSEKKEKNEIIELLRKQMKVEGRLLGLYEKSVKEISNAPVRLILHMIN